MTYTPAPAEPMPLFYESWSQNGGLGSEGRPLCATSTSQIAALAWPAAQLAIYMPMYLSAPFGVASIFWHNAAINAAALIDAGVYDESGKILFQTNTTANAGANLPQSVAKTYTLPRGRYYIAMAVSTVTTATFQKWTATNVGTQRMLGILEQALGAAPAAGNAWLPATATFASATTAATFVPIVGISRLALL